MPFQSTVNAVQAEGIVGDIVIDGPQRGQPGILSSTSAANNVVGRAFRHVSGSDTDVTADAAGNFAGILANSKTYATSGTTAGGTLAPTLTLPNETIGELVTMTSGILVDISTDADIGDNVFYADATGILAADAGTTLAGHTQIVGAKIVRNNIPSAGLAIVELT